MLLRTEHLTKRYGSFPALDDFSFSVSAGEVVGLLGPNGSGKTTALRLMLGFLRPTSGSATIGGHDCWRASVAARRLVAYLPGELRLYENMSGRQLIRFLGDLRGQPVNGEVEALARRFDIDIDRPIANLSSGMKRKVALLQVLAPHTPLVIMDEPTNTLDPTMRDLLLEQVEAARARGQAVLFSSHVLTEVERVCDRVAILRRGRLVHDQKVAEFQAGRLVTARFDGPAPAAPTLDGLRVRERHGDRLTVEYTGAMAELLGWLSRQPLAELRMEPLGLNAVYYRYHGNAE
ncbi:MAG: ABC transporter ATP-binding protein [Gemmataceae bacterium]